MRVFALTIFLVTRNICFSQCDTSNNLSQKEIEVKKYILNLKHKNYTGERIGDFLQRDNIKEYCKHSYLQKVIGVLSGINLSYKGFVIQIRL